MFQKGKYPKPRKLSKAVASAIRLDQKLSKAVASANRLDQKLKHLTLQMEAGFTDEAGVALAETLTVNKSLCDIFLSVLPSHGIRRVDNKPTFGAQSYEAFISAMLRVNTSLMLDLPSFEFAGATFFA
jgi:hypothetical protein